MQPVITLNNIPDALMLLDAHENKNQDIREKNKSQGHNYTSTN